MRLASLGWLLIIGLFSNNAIASFAVEDIPLLQYAINSSHNKSFQPKKAELAPDLKILQTRYLAYFFNDIDLNKIDHYFYKFESGQYDIVAQLFLNDINFESVIISHGYLDHAGFNQPLVKFLLNNHFNVIVFDQPGHGLSSGNRSEIDDFSTYQTILTTTFNQFKPYVTQPIHVIGHSTANVGIIDLLSNQAPPWQGETIMLAPLIRSKLWGTSKFFYKVGSWVFKSIPRKFRNNSHNKPFRKWLKKEPFVIKKISKSWIDAHHQWEKDIQNYKISQREFTVIQGTKDIIVDFKYNQTYLLEYFPNLNLIHIKGANHHLINETQSIQNDVLTTILTVINKDKH